MVGVGIWLNIFLGIRLCKWREEKKRTQKRCLGEKETWARKVTRSCRNFGAVLRNFDCGLTAKGKPLWRLE